MGTSPEGNANGLTVVALFGIRTHRPARAIAVAGSSAGRSFRGRRVPTEAAEPIKDAVVDDHQGHLVPGTKISDGAARGA